MYEEYPSGDARNATASVLSPFDEQEEWARISEIMATIGSGLVKESGFVSELEQEFQARLGLSRSGSLTDSSPVAPLIEPASESAPDVPVVQSVQEWLETCKLQEYKDVFLNYGYDHVKFLVSIDFIYFYSYESETVVKIVYCYLSDIFENTCSQHTGHIVGPVRFPIPT